MTENHPKRILFVAAICKDRPGQEAVDAREEFMSAHAEYVISIMDKILVAGPIFADDGETVIGSNLIYKTDDKDEARKLLEGDPYFNAPIWDSIEYHTFRGAIGDAVGGLAF